MNISFVLLKCIVLFGFEVASYLIASIPRYVDIVNVCLVCFEITGLLATKITPWLIAIIPNRSNSMQISFVSVQSSY